MKRQLALASLIETNSGLFGVSKADGSVWVYQGGKHGWSKLNMDVMSKQDLRAKMGSRARVQAESEYEPPFD